MTHFLGSKMCSHFLQQLGSLCIDSRLHSVQVGERLLHALVLVELEALLVEREGLLGASYVANWHGTSVHLVAPNTCCANEDMVTDAEWRVQIVLHLCSDGIGLAFLHRQGQCLRL